MRYLLICAILLFSLGVATAQSNKTITMEVLGKSSLDYRGGSANRIALAVHNEEYGFHIIDIVGDEDSRHFDAAVSKKDTITFILIFGNRKSSLKKNNIKNKIWYINFDDLIEVDNVSIKNK